MANTKPVVNANDHSLHLDEWSQVAGWFSYSDADGNPATQYQLWDSGTGATSAYYWTPGGGAESANTLITVSAADLANTWVRGGHAAGAETLWVRAFDGTDWSNWDTYTLTTLANTKPVATINDHNLHTNEWSQASSWISYSDADANPATQYQFWDSGTGATSGYFYTSSNSHWDANTVITVDAADLANTWVRGGSATGAETMWVRAFDGYDWSNWDTFTLNTIPNTPPVATINDHNLHTNEWSQVSSWISYSDADANPATQYQFWDSGTGATSGYFWTPGNSHWDANTVVTVNAADLANTWVRGGSATGAETMWVRAFDGSDWGNWDSFTLNTIPNTAPVATINDHSLHINEWSQVSSWISYSDADANPATQYQFFDSGTGATSGYFWTQDNSHWDANTVITVNAADLNNTYVRGGQAAGSETMWVRAFDGSDWSSWDSFSFTTLPNNAPMATINDHILHTNEWSQASSWISYSDADANPATQYQFWDGGGNANSGYFWTAAHGQEAAGGAITVNPADLGNVWVRGGAAAGSETMYVRAFDGIDWSSWDSFTLTTIL